MIGRPQGAIFDLLDEHKTDAPKFERTELDFTQCHIAAGTRGVPGVLLRSIFPNSDRNPGSQDEIVCNG